MGTIILIFLYFITEKTKKISSCSCIVFDFLNETLLCANNIQWNPLIEYNLKHYSYVSDIFLRSAERVNTTMKTEKKE